MRRNKKEVVCDHCKEVIYKEIDILPPRLITRDSCLMKPNVSWITTSNGRDYCNEECAIDGEIK